MGSMSDYLENKVLEHTVGKTAYALPTVFVALYTAVPSESGQVNEITGNGYQRATVSFGSAANGQISNNANISFPAATGSWGTVAAIGLVDSQGSGTGNLLWYGSLDAAKTIGSGDQYVIPSGSLTITLD